MSKWNYKSFLGLCLVLFSFLSFAQCPPEYDCEVPPEEEGGGNYDLFYTNCLDFIQSQGWNADGSTWMRVCQSCTKCYEYWDSEGFSWIECSDFPTVMNCTYINKQWGTAQAEILPNYPNNDIEIMSFDKIMNVMKDITDRAVITKASIAMANFKVPCDPEDDCDPPGDEEGGGNASCSVCDASQGEWCVTLGNGYYKCCKSIGTGNGNVVCDYYWWG